MPTAKKAAVIEDLTDKLGRINAAALIEYRGLTVAEISELRSQLRQREIELQVTKNTLLREAAHRSNITELDEMFNGPTAVAFIYGDESTGTKALNDYFRTARVGQIKSGILKGGRGLTAEQFTKLADLPNRQTLLAQIAGLLESPMTQLAALFNAPQQQLAYAIAALQDKAKEGGDNATVASVTGVTVPEPAAQPAASDAPVEAPATEPETSTTEATGGATPASEVVSDASRAPEEEGSAGTAPTGGTTEATTAQEAAEDPASAPESAGGAEQ